MEVLDGSKEGVSEEVCLRQDGLQVRRQEANDPGQGKGQDGKAGPQGLLMAKKVNKKWIQKATASIKKRGTEGVCSGKKFGGKSCPPGSKRYNLAKTFKKMGRKRRG